MSLLDWGILVVILGVGLSGFFKGAVRIVFGLGGILTGIWLAAVAGSDVAGLLAPWLGGGWLAAVAARAMLLLACAGLCLVAGWGIEQSLKALHLGWLDRLVGAGLAAALAVILVGALILTGARFSPAFAGLCERSLLPPQLLAMLGGRVVWSEPEPTQSEAPPVEAGDEAVDEPRDESGGEPEDGPTPEGPAT
jgi:uncharacterized membrane protein required for colicin V production